MDNKNKNLMFKKGINQNHNNNTSNIKNKKDMAKLALMKKYNMSSEKAEGIIEKIEKKQQDKNMKKPKHFENKPQMKKIDNYQTSQKKHDSENLKELNNKNNNINKQKTYRNNKKNNFNQNKPQFNTDSIKQREISEKNHDKNMIKTDIKNESDFHTPQNQATTKQNVDNIISDIIPSYNQQVSIEVNHVDLTFEVSNEKIDTLKETFIRTLKRNKAKKLKIHALKDINFKIYKGEKIGLIGYNGAGKSTLLNVITGIYPPDKGFVKTEGNISPLLSLGAGFDYNYSGRKNIFLNGAVLGYEKSFLESKVNEIIEFSELGDFIDIPIKNYSSGMLAKLGFSIATAVEPDILIIDEILGVGDVNFSKKSTDKIKSLMDGGTTVLFVSHSIPQVREICDKAIWIDQGSIKEIGEVNKVCDHYLKDSEKASNEQLANIQLN